MADQHERAVPADGRFDESPQKVAMCCKPVSIGAGVLEFVGSTHPNQIRGDTAARLGNFRHDVAPQVRRGRVAVQKEKNRRAVAELDIGHALAVDGEELLGVRFDAVRSGHRRFLRAAMSHDRFDLVCSGRQMANFARLRATNSSSVSGGFPVSVSMTSFVPAKMPSW